MSLTVSFTGHRCDKLGGWNVPNPVYNAIVAELERVLTELKPDKAITGLALGFDTWAAEVCIKLGIPYIGASPCDDQDRVWRPESKVEFKRLVEKADEFVVVSLGPYAAWKMQARNCWMVDHSDIVVAAFNGSSGGTGNCIRYAKSKGKRIVNVYTPEVAKLILGAE